MSGLTSLYKILARLISFALTNRVKIKHYLINYRSADRFLFNDLFRLLLERNSTKYLFQVTEKSEWLLSLSADYWVLKILISEKLNENEKTSAIFKRLIEKKFKISPYYFELNIFREAYSREIPHYSLVSLQSLFKVENSLLMKRFVIGHATCVIDPDQFLPEFVKLQLNGKSKDTFFSVFDPFEITNIEEVCFREVVISPPSVLHFNEPHSFGESGPRVLRSVQVPAACVWTIKNCQLIGASQVVKDKKFVIYDKSGNPKNGFVAGIWNFIIHIKNSNRVLINRDFKAIKNQKIGVLIAGRCSKNYFHWLIEYVPKILNILTINKLDAPLIVDSSMPEQSYAILEHVCKKFNLTYILASSEDLINFDELIIPSQHTYQPDDPSFTHWESSALSIEHINFVSALGLEMAKELSTEIKHDKIYLSRKNFSARKIINEKDIELLFRRYGFHIVDPTNLSFVQQVSLFSNAKTIASPTGAAFANLIFCSENTNVLSLVAEENKGFCIQANLALLKKLNFSHVTGDLVQKRESFNSYQEYRYSEFKMDLDKLEAAILSMDTHI